jgi:hypothetical protein
LEQWLHRKAYESWRTRALEWHTTKTIQQILEDYQRSSGSRSLDDWENARLYLAMGVLDGEFDLVRSLTPESYGRLEGENGQMWLTEVKKLKAYLTWLGRNGGWEDDHKYQDYLVACQQNADAVANPGRKAPQSAFEPFQTHIDSGFLDAKGKLDLNKPKTASWIYAKTARIGALAEAINYMTAFYENITHAVLAPDESNTRFIIEALGLRGGHEKKDAMVNCFEMAVAIYFLDPALAAKTMAQ